MFPASLCIRNDELSGGIFRVRELRVKKPTCGRKGQPWADNSAQRRFLLFTPFVD
jgi:hypothetical protein